MSESDQFRQYAEEALLWAAQSTTKEESNSCWSWCAPGLKRQSQARGPLPVRSSTSWRRYVEVSKRNEVANGASPREPVETTEHRRRRDGLARVQRRQASWHPK
jgi:hypothetical protein